jgi:hypothetical protein
VSYLWVTAQTLSMIRDQVPMVRDAKKELTPLEVNGITAVTIGTGLWSVATLIMVLMRDQLEASGRGNWIAIGVCGIILGLLGMRYTKRRVARIERAKAN